MILFTTSEAISIGNVIKKATKIITEIRQTYPLVKFQLRLIVELPLTFSSIAKGTTTTKNRVISHNIMMIGTSAETTISKTVGTVNPRTIGIFATAAKPANIAAKIATRMTKPMKIPTPIRNIKRNVTKNCHSLELTYRLPASILSG